MQTDRESSHGGVFSGLREILRDKTRDTLCADLGAIGVDARMVERGKIEEHVVGRRWFWSPKCKSLGLIEIRDSPIHWVNVLKRELQEDGNIYSNIYLILDPTICREEYLELKSVRVKNVRVLEKAVNLRWEANFEDDLIRQMNEDVLLSRRLIQLGEDIEICRYPEQGYWAMSSTRYQAGWGGQVVRQPALSREKWDSYETVARRLLEPRGK